MAAAVLLLGLPGTALAHGAEQGHLVVPGDHVDPGSTIQVAGSELIGGSEVVLRLESGSTIVELGRATVLSGGSLSTTVRIPESFPLGYAELSATDLNGNHASTFVLIGDRPEGPGATPGESASDDRTFWLVVAGIGLVTIVVVGLWSLRGRPRASQIRE